MSELTREEVLEHLAEVARGLYVTERLDTLKPNEFTMRDLYSKGLSEKQSKMLVEKMVKEGKMTKRMVKYQGKARNIMTWLDGNGRPEEKG